MTDQLDRIRVWNEEISEMMEPMTIQEMLSMERNVRIYEDGICVEEEHAPEDYSHLVFMRNTGIYSEIRVGGVHKTDEEIFAEDLVTHSIEPYVYRVMQKRGCWWAMSLCTYAVPARLLNSVFHPRIVGNIYENRELFMKGEIAELDREV